MLLCLAVHRHARGCVVDAPVEVTMRYATSVDGLPAAWAFVMARLDSVGPDPRITISPIWTAREGLDEEGQEWPRRFEVVVEGMVEEGDAEREGA